MTAELENYMTSYLLHVAATALVAGSACSAAAQTVEDEAIWLNATLMGRLGEKLVYFAEVQPRVTDSASRLSQVLLRPAIVLFSGILAGAAAAVVSQPADVLLTRICASTSVANCALDAAGSFREQLAELARGGLREAYAGLGPRLAMVSAMTSVQFLLYDWVRCQLQCESTPPRAEG